MITVTGKPRCGTSMMMHCLHLAGVPLAFEDIKRDKKQMERFKNPYGFYEGRWNGTDGLLKCFSPFMFEKFPNPRFIVMTRDDKKIQASWKAIQEQIKQPNVPKIRQLTPEEREKMLARIKKNTGAEFGNIRGLNKTTRIPIPEAVLKYPHITVDYDTFVNDPEHYRKDFETLLPELDFDVIKSGVDKSLYINR